MLTYFYQLILLLQTSGISYPQENKKKPNQKLEKKIPKQPEKEVEVEIVVLRRQ